MPENSGKVYTTTGQDVVTGIHCSSHMFPITCQGMRTIARPPKIECAYQNTVTVTTVRQSLLSWLIATCA